MKEIQQMDGSSTLLCFSHSNHKTILECVQVSCVSSCVF